MKTEPTAATAASIYGLMDLELADLNINPGESAFSSVESATGYVNTSADAILDEMEIVVHALKGARLAQSPEEIHGKFTEIYRAAATVAGMSVRLAAIARSGIIQSDTMARIDRADPGAFYG